MAPRLLCHDLLATEVALCFSWSTPGIGRRGMEHERGAQAGASSMTDLRALRIEMERGASSGVGDR